MCGSVLCVINVRMENHDRDKLVEAFEHMVESVHESVHQAEEALAPTIDEMVHNAQQMARDIYALTQEEADSLGATLKRDLHKANEVLNEQKKELRDWLSFDLAVVEDKFIDLVARAADKTWLDLRAFGSGKRSAGYHSGEVCNAGSFRCEQCGKTLRLRRSARIPPCPACHHGVFQRILN